MLKIKQKMVSASLCCLLPSAVLAQLPEGGIRQDAPSQDAAVQVQQKQWLDILSEEERSSEKNENVGEPPGGSGGPAARRWSMVCPSR